MIKKLERNQKMCFKDVPECVDYDAAILREMGVAV